MAEYDREIRGLTFEATSPLGSNDIDPAKLIEKFGQAPEEVYALAELMMQEIANQTAVLESILTACEKDPQLPEKIGLHLPTAKNALDSLLNSRKKILKTGKTLRQMQQHSFIDFMFELHRHLQGIVI
jgi:hypothetical protein